MMVKKRWVSIWAACLALFLMGCDITVKDVTKIWKNEIELPTNPVERAAVLGVQNSFQDSTMWEVKEIRALRVQPMVPTKDFVMTHDPKELYCVCVEYEARYKVPWTTTDKSPWERAVRNVLVIKTKGDQFLAMRPAAICHPTCE